MQTPEMEIAVRVTKWYLGWMFLLQHSSHCANHLAVKLVSMCLNGWTSINRSQEVCWKLGVNTDEFNMITCLEGSEASQTIRAKHM